MKNQSFHKRLGFAINGLRFTLKSESSFKFHCIATVCAIVLLTYLRAAPFWWATFLLAIGLVLTSELFNTALEYLIDRLHPETHPTIKLVKDCAAGAVLVSSIISAGILLAFIINYFN